jgi:hypothetical protein
MLFITRSGFTRGVLVVCSHSVLAIVINACGLGQVEALLATIARGRENV